MGKIRGRVVVCVCVWGGGGDMGGNQREGGGYIYVHLSVCLDSVDIHTTIVPFC